MTHRKADYIVGFGFVLLALIGLGVDPFTSKAPTLQATTTKAWVDDDDPSCGGNSPCFTTIQAAIDAIQLEPYRSGTVYIRPGLYREHVVLTKNVELIGAGRELVRLEAPDPATPAISVKGTSVSKISGLGIYGGLVGILVEDAQVFTIRYNRIAGYTEAGIRLVRSAQDTFISYNELPDLERGVDILDGSRAFIVRNIIRGILAICDKECDQGGYVDIQENLLGTIQIYGKGSALIERNQLISALGVGQGILIRTGAEAKILANQIQGYTVGIGIIGGVANIANNLILQNEYGIAAGDPVHALPQSPRFRIVQNRIIANTHWGLALYQGQRLFPHPTDLYAQVYKNWISENRGGVEFGSRVWLDLSSNWIVNNGIGICPTLGAADKGALVGSNNEIRDNTEDICSDGIDYPWPPGFRK